MSNVLMRVLRYRASVLLDSPEAFFKQELTSKKTNRFEDDLSIFEILESEVIRTHAEYVGNGLAPKNNDLRSGVDLQGIELPGLIKSAGKSKWFSFFRDRHRSVPLLDEDEAMALARALIVGLLARERQATDDDVRAFVNARLAERDPEWFACLNDTDPDPKRQSQCRAWRRFLARQPKPKDATTPNVPGQQSDGASPATTTNGSAALSNSPNEQADTKNLPPPSAEPPAPNAED